MLEPGLDRHEWESRWQALEEPMSDAPAEALPELDALVQQMLAERGYAIDDPVAREGDDREIVAEFLSAREITRMLDQGSDDVSPGDVAAAINGYRSVYEYLRAERSGSRRLPWLSTQNRQTFVRVCPVSSTARVVGSSPTRVGVLAGKD